MADNYQILNQRPDIELSPTGIGFHNVWQITYKVTDGPSKGTTAQLTVPDSDHNATYVKAAIEAKISALDAVASL